MSKMGEHFLNTAADRADRDADEVAWLRDEVTRLEGTIGRASLLLDEGDPQKVLGKMSLDLLHDGWEEEARDIAELAATLARVRALLKA